LEKELQAEKAKPREEKIPSKHPTDPPRPRNISQCLPLIPHALSIESAVKRFLESAFSQNSEAFDKAIQKVTLTLKNQGQDVELNRLLTLLPTKYQDLKSSGQSESGTDSEDKWLGEE
jgi:hypothetical protein